MNWKDLTIKEIETYLVSEGFTEEVLEELLKDERIGVVSLARKYQKCIDREKEKLARWEHFAQPEERVRKMGYKLIAGIDEAGRGPLAGPVVAAAVILNSTHKIIGLDDSKKLNEQEREKFFEIIKLKALTIGIGIIDNITIDKVNILQATFKAMKKAVNQLQPKPEYLLVDGNREIPGITIKQETIIDGDAKSNAIAAASIIAKVTRDRILYKYHRQYPEYQFESNKGYGTSQHVKALEKYGPCPIHRYTFSVVSKYHFLHIRDRITRAETPLELKEIGEAVARKGLFSEENLKLLRELYREQHNRIAAR